MKKFALFIVLSLCLFSLQGCGSAEVPVNITILSGSTEEFVFSDEEISPFKNQITITSGEGLADTEVILHPVECKEENAYEPAYLTPGMAVKMDVEKGAWFKIGVSVQNPTDEDIVVSVNVTDAHVRVA